MEKIMIYGLYILLRLGTICLGPHIKIKADL